MSYRSVCGRGLVGGGGAGGCGTDGGGPGGCGRPGGDGLGPGGGGGVPGGGAPGGRGSLWLLSLSSPRLPKKQARAFNVSRGDVRLRSIRRV